MYVAEPMPSFYPPWDDFSVTAPVDEVRAALFAVNQLQRLGPPSDTCYEDFAGPLPVPWKAEGHLVPVPGTGRAFVLLIERSAARLRLYDFVRAFELPTHTEIAAAMNFVCHHLCAERGHVSRTQP